jgi:hypothetical protein
VSADRQVRHLVNLTPHPLHIRGQQDADLELPIGGPAARLVEQRFESEPAVFDETEVAVVQLRYLPSVETFPAQLMALPTSSRG